MILGIRAKWWAVAWVILLLSGCGGGDEGSTPPPEPEPTPIPETNQPPTAAAGADQSVAGGQLVTLDGSGSSDSDGTIASYAWTQTAGTTVTLTGTDSSVVKFTAPEVTTSTPLTFQLSVTDDAGATSTDEIIVTILPPVANQPPVAAAGADQAVSGGITVTLNGSASSDPDGSIRRTVGYRPAATPLHSVARTPVAPSSRRPWSRPVRLWSLS